MTKVQAQFKLARPLDAEAAKRLADTSSLYGILRLYLDPAQDGLTVEYDATRLKEKDVEAALHRAGVAIQPIT
jgi:hypothetical protein